MVARPAMVPVWVQVGVVAVVHADASAAPVVPAVTVMVGSAVTACSTRMMGLDIRTTGLRFDYIWDMGLVMVRSTVGMCSEVGGSEKCWSVSRHISGIKWQIVQPT